MNKKQTFVKVKLQVEGIHNWPQAQGSVEYLKHLHRHLFYITILKSVTHDDRDIEIITFKNEVGKYIADKYFSVGDNCHNFGPMSCEMIAKELHEQFQCFSVEVLEDNENGAVVM